MNNRTYSRSQIGLHWLVALLVPVQYLTGGSIERTHHAVHMGMTPAAWDVVQHHVHNYSGMVIASLMAIRLVLRIISRPQSSPSNSVPDRIGRVLHHGFYAAIIGQASMGFIASYLWFGIAPYHVLGSKIILAMVALHFAAAAWHTLVAKDETLDRMILPRSDASAKNLQGN
ncbi:cytochrome b [Rhizobium leguminosarum]|uniref:cytochrome b n=1 Tax=Rhizobium leguminosarum TaxID=384 RepID=UPI003F961AF6